MVVCWFGIYDPAYSRNRILLDGLESANVKVIQCNTFGLTGVKKYIQLVKLLLSHKNEYDILYCAYPINYSVILAKLFQKRPIVIDAFYPLYEAYITDRKKYSRFNIRGFIYKFLDRINLTIADLVVADTEEHRKFWLKMAPHSRVTVVPVGVHSKEFFPLPEDKNKEFLVTFHGTYIPLQGIQKIVEAADLLRNESQIKFRFIGRGQSYLPIKKEIENRKLDIELLPMLTIPELNTKLNEASVILGIFGSGEKALRVIPNKVFQGLAVRKPVITMDSPAMRELFSKDEVYLIENSASGIVTAIRELFSSIERRESLSEKGYAKVKMYTEKQLGNTLATELKSLI